MKHPEVRRLPPLSHTHVSSARSRMGKRKRSCTRSYFAPCGAVLSCVDKKVPKEATRGEALNRFPMVTMVVSQLFSSEITALSSGLLSRRSALVDKYFLVDFCVASRRFGVINCSSNCDLTAPTVQQGRSPISIRGVSHTETFNFPFSTFN